LNFDNIKEELEEEGSLRNSLFKRYKQLISIRIHEPCFDPFSKFEFLSLGKECFAVKHYAKEGDDYLITLHNFTNQEIQVDLSQHIDGVMIDIITHQYSEHSDISLQAYGILWLKPLNR